MADSLSLEERSRNMSAIRSTHTKLEDRISRQLWHFGIRFRKNAKKLNGKPDIAIKKYKIVIFIDSCFWHACNTHGRIPKSNSEFWIKKFERNKKRDFSITQYYKDNGWNILRIWEHDIEGDFEECISCIVEFIICIKNFYKPRGE